MNWSGQILRTSSSTQYCTVWEMFLVCLYNWFCCCVYHVFWILLKLVYLLYNLSAVKNWFLSFSMFIKSDEFIFQAPNGGEDMETETTTKYIYLFAQKTNLTIILKKCLWFFLRNYFLPSLFLAFFSPNHLFFLNFYNKGLVIVLQV